MATYAPQYTLHDEQHLLRVVDLMGHMIGADVGKLSALEIALLILSAYYHDTGMVPTKEKYQEIIASEKYKLHGENWKTENPNYRELQQFILGNGRKAEVIEHAEAKIAELDSAILTDYLRTNHASISAQYVRSELGEDKRLQIDGVSLAPYLASLCESHTLPVDDIPNLHCCSWDEQIASRTVNMIYLALVLRIADILDFDRERTPEALFKSIHFTSAVSIREWEKHRSVSGWLISPDCIRYTVECSHPSYHQAAEIYMNWIEREIRDAKGLLSKQPHSVEKREINLPAVVDRSRIRAKHNAYRLHSLEFTLGRDEIVRLLMTDKLYGNPSLCVRELLQNSLDALRYRKALFAESSVDWNEGKVELLHYRNQSGEEVLSCQDNGVGMDEEVISNFLTKVGRSYYRSPFFESERNRLRKSGLDFDPCSKFGIGFMSCFMIGDRIEIRTRKDYGKGREWGVPLVVEIQGLSGAVIVREGEEGQQPGTSISIVSRHFKDILDEWDDSIQLCSVVDGYALATEFKIIAKCAIDGISEVFEVPTDLAVVPTKLEILNVQSVILYEQELSSVHPELRGYVRESFLIDESGVLCFQNAEGCWARKPRHEDDLNWTFIPGQAGEPREQSPLMGVGDVSICIDGILLTGPPGRSREFHRRMRLGWKNSNVYSRFSALVDARGSMKPEFTPSRTAPDRGFSKMYPKWSQLELHLEKATGLLLERVLRDYFDKNQPADFWKLFVIYGESPLSIPSQSVVELLRFPERDESGAISWKAPHALGRMKLVKTDDADFAIFTANGIIAIPEDLFTWERGGCEHTKCKPRLLSWIQDCLIRNCILDINDDQVFLRAVDDFENYASPVERRIRNEFGAPRLVIPFKNALSKAISATTSVETLNCNHPLVKALLSGQFSEHPTALENFASAFVGLVAKAAGESLELHGLKVVSRWQKRAAHLFFAVPWNSIGKEYSEPYHYWTPTGFQTINRNTFEEWRDAKVLPLDT